MDQDAAALVNVDEVYDRTERLMQGVNGTLAVKEILAVRKVTVGEIPSALALTFRSTIRPALRRLHPFACGSEVSSSPVVNFVSSPISVCLVRGVRGRRCRTNDLWKLVCADGWFLACSHIFTQLWVHSV
jgi:hypothetical protein